jgi:hypothetical protein
MKKRSMTIPEILKEFELYTGQLPVRAMMEAVRQAEAVTPELLRILETVAENPAGFGARRDYMAHLFAMYLLAQFREKRAYAPIVRIFSAPGDTSYDLAGDTVSEGLHRVLASVYDGNPAPLRGLVENASANEYVRGTAIHTFRILHHSGQMSRDEVAGYYHGLFHGKLERKSSYAWNALVWAVAALPAPELLEEVRQAFAGRLADEESGDLGEFELELAAPDPPPGAHEEIVTHAIAEMAAWSCFNPEEEFFGVSSKSFPDPPPLIPVPSRVSDEPYVPPKPFIRTEPKIGRNDPCPCGSGKKHKKCCGQA